VFRAAFLNVVFVCVASSSGFGQKANPEWHMVYTPSHRATYVKEWTYRFPNHHSKRWIIALRYPPTLAWSRNVAGKAELLTSNGWKPFQEVTEGSREKRRMLVIDYNRDDPKLRSGFNVRTSFTATICNQQLRKGKPTTPLAPLAALEKAAFLAETDTFDFNKPNVKKWMDEHKMWLAKGEAPIDFVRRVYRELRLPKNLPYDTKDGGKWVCSQILTVGYGECCRHAIVGTSILRANKIPARTVCGLWAIDNQSKGGHCWGEFFLDGAGWVPYDTTIDSNNSNTEAYFGTKKGEVLAGMIDFDWVVDAGPFGKQTVFAVDAFPAFWSEGKGNMDDSKLDATESVRVLRGLR
jgi:transglutaminase-like putative cysteine protease